MGRILGAGFVACMALAFVASPVSAGDDVQGELEKLKQEVQDLRATMLEQDINTYLSETEGWKGVQGGDGLRGVTIHARFTTVTIGTVGVDPSDVGVVDGDVDLDIDFQVTDNLSLFIKMTANNGGAGTLPGNFAVTGISSGSPLTGGATLSGWDGIGVDGTVPTNPGAVTTYEAGIRATTPISNGEFHWEMGELDPRTRFLQNAFADDENTQFLNNLFDDPSAVPWLTNAVIPVTSLGWHLWIDFGANKQYTVSVGWFNTPGEWWKNGQLYVQFAWKGEVKGRAMNIRALGFMSEHPLFGGDDDSTGGGVSWDWMATDKIGVFVRIAVNNENLTVPVGLDASVGGVLHGVGSRADDRLGLAVGFSDPNDDALGTGGDVEVVVEVYYMYSAQDGKLQITPFVQFISDPGGGATVSSFVDDSLFILGVRIHVPF